MTTHRKPYVLIPLNDILFIMTTTCTLPRTITVSKLLEEIKRSSSMSQLDELVKYISNQYEHHRSISFEEELVILFDKYKIRYDSKYLWD